MTNAIDPGIDPAINLATVSRVRRVAVTTGERLKAVFSTENRAGEPDALMSAVQVNEAVANAGLREALHEIRPNATFVGAAQETEWLPDGEWWVVDAVEGNINHVHGLPSWAVSIALVSNGRPVLAVVRQPVGDRTYTALAGSGARLNGQVLHVSTKTRLDISIVETGQAEAGQRSTFGRIGASVTAMLHEALVVRVGVPSTFPMLAVAAGHSDAFWQYQPHLPGIAAGVLMVTEAGGVTTTIAGEPWAPGSDTVLVAAPGIHAAAAEALRGVR